LPPLLVGALLGFIAGYFAAGGARPSGAAPAKAAATAPASAAVSELEKAVEKDPQNPQALKALGNGYYDLGEWDHAADAYERARRKNTGDANLLSDLGVAYRNLGEFRKAATMFHKAREANPDHWQSLLNLVLLETFDRRDGVAAQKQLEEVKRRFPEIPNLDRLQEQVAKIRG
jgi:Tfp pilus assembly protein PilF